MHSDLEQLAVLAEYIHTALIKLEFTDFNADEINAYLNREPSEDTVTVELDKPNDGLWIINIRLVAGEDVSGE